VEGRDYRFVSPETFKTLIEDGSFLEWAEVFGQRYGTLLAPIADALEQGRDVLLEIDVQGAATVRERMPDAVLIFLQPPSEEDLVRRLRARHTEDEADLARRLASARHEMEQAGWFDRVVVNDDVERAAAEVAAIIDGVTKENPHS
jgi:guanylate kinase